MENPSESPISRGPGLDSFRGASRLERALLPFLREPTLWPIFLVLVAHVVLLVAPLIAFAWMDLNGWSIVVLVVLAIPSVLAIASELRARRSYLISGLIGALWLVSGLSAWVAVFFEIL